MAELPLIPFVNEIKGSFAWETYFTLFCGVGGMMDIAQNTMTRTGCASCLWNYQAQELHLLVCPTFARVSQITTISGSRYYWGIDMTAGKFGGILNTCTWIVAPVNLGNESWRLVAAKRFTSSALEKPWQVSSYWDRYVNMQSQGIGKPSIDPASWQDIVHTFWAEDQNLQPNTSKSTAYPHWHSPLFTRDPQGFGYVTDYYHPPTVYLPSLS